MSQISMYDVKQCVRGNSAYLFVWEQLILMPDSDEIWKKAQKLVKEEDHLNTIVLTNPYQRSVIHQKIPTMVRQKTDDSSPNVLESVPPIVVRALRTTKEPKKNGLDWNKIRVYSFPEGTRLGFSAGYVVEAHYQDTSIIVEEFWEMDNNDGDVLFVLTNKESGLFCLCVLTTQTV